MKRALALLVLFMFIPVFVVFGGHRWLQLWGHKPRVLPVATTVELSRGESLKEFSRELAAAGVVEHPVLFQVWTRLFSKYHSFQAGRYQVPVEYSIESLAGAIKAGRTYNPVVVQFTIPEGFRISQVAARLAAQGIGTVDEIQRLTRNPRFIAKLKVPALSLEGYLYPATYSFTEVPSPQEALGIMVNTFWEKLPAEYESDVASLGLTLQEAVTFASLIELETHHDDERTLVAEVIWNRLRKQVALAIDAAIIYGIKDYQGDIKRKHLEDASNPYNTRKHRGLPPGPIGSPSRASLEALLTPTSFGYFYYVLDLETGKHNFSKTLADHNRFVQKMLRDRRRLRAERADS